MSRGFSSLAVSASAEMLASPLLRKIVRDVPGNKIRRESSLGRVCAKEKDDGGVLF